MKFYRLNLNENKSIEPEDLTIRKEKKKGLRKINIKGRKICIDRESMEKSRSFKNQPKYYLKDGRWHAVESLTTKNGIKNTHYNVAAPLVKTEVMDKIKQIKLPEGLKAAIGPALAAATTYLVIKKIQDVRNKPKVETVINKEELTKEFTKLHNEAKTINYERKTSSMARRQFPKTAITYAVMALAPVIATQVYDKFQQTKFSMKVKNYEKQSGTSFRREVYEKGNK